MTGYPTVQDIIDLGPTVKCGQLNDYAKDVKLDEFLQNGQPIVECDEPLHDLWLDLQIVWVWWTTSLAERSHFSETEDTHTVEICESWVKSYRDRLLIQCNMSVQAAVLILQEAHVSIKLNQTTNCWTHSLWRKSRITRILDGEDYKNYRMVFERAKPVYEDGRHYPMAKLHTILAKRAISRR